MAIVFNATTTKVEHTTANVLNSANTISVLAWLWLTGFGEGNAGRIVTLPESGSSRLNVDGAGAANRLRWTWDFTGGGSADGAWLTPTNSLATGRWFCVATTYDRSDVANDPVMYIRDTDTSKNLVSQSVSELTTPVGTGGDPATGYCVGNIGGSTATFDGRIGYLQVWNRILSAGELNTAMHFPGRITGSLRLFLPLIKDGADWSGLAQSGTETDTAIGDGPPCAAPFQGFADWFGAFTAAAVAGGKVHRLALLGVG